MNEAEKLLVKLYNTRHTGAVFDLKSDSVIHNKSQNKLLTQLFMDGFVESMICTVAGAEYTNTTINIDNQSILLDLTSKGIEHAIMIQQREFAKQAKTLSIIAAIIGIVAIVAAVIIACVS